ncbi:MAG: hypothetical protein M9938_04535 [Solirubrobacterales bacterium]|nr:hypothetical protein [Solirubrobacterales bacterium]
MNSTESHQPVRLLGRPATGILALALLLIAFSAWGVSSASANGTIIATKGGDRSASTAVSGATTYADPVGSANANDGALFEWTTGDPTLLATVWTAFPSRTGVNGQASASVPGATSGSGTVYYVREKDAGLGFRDLGAQKELSFGSSPPQQYVARVQVRDGQTTYAYPHSNSDKDPDDWTPSQGPSVTNNGSPFINARDNSDLPNVCGLNILLVLDRSGSIEQDGDPAAYAAAAKEFVTQLDGTPTQIAITSFSSNYQGNFALNSYTGGGQGDSDFYHAPVDLETGNPVTSQQLKDTIDDVYANPAGGTNWDIALKDASIAAGFDPKGGAAGRTDKPDLVVFITDGNPTVNQTVVPGTGGSTQMFDLTAGMASANSIKARSARAGFNSRILAIGVSNPGGTPPTAANLKAVSGPTQGVDGDYAVPSLDQLKSFLRELAAKQCGARVYVRKRLQGDATNQPNWKYTAVDPRPGAPAPTYLDGNNATHASGSPPVVQTGAFFTKLPMTPTTVQVNENANGQPLAAGTFNLDSVVCRNGDYDNGTIVNGTQTGLNFSLQVNRGDSVYCTYTNSQNTTLKVTKTPDAGVVSPGGDAEFTIQVKNEGSVTALNPVISDQLPAPGATPWTVSQQPTGGGTCSVNGSNLLTCTGVPNLGAGQTTTLKVKTTTTFEKCGTYDNPAAKASATNAPETSDGGKITCVPPNLGVLKTAVTGTIDAGDNAVFTIVTENTGDGTATGVTLDDPLPTDVSGPWTITDQPAGDPCEITGDANTGYTLKCDFGDLTKQDGPRSVTVSAPTDFDHCSELLNWAHVKSTNAPEASDDATIYCQKPNLSVLKTTPSDTINAGEDVEFTIEVSNSGPGTAKGVSLTDPLPTGVSGSWVITSPVDGPCTIVGDPGEQQTLSCPNLGDLGVEATFSVTVKAPTDRDNCTLYDNEATAKATNAPEATGEAMVTCRKPALATLKTAVEGTINAGDDAVFTIVTSNTGDGTAKDVTLSDPLPTGGVSGPWTITDQPGSEGEPPCQIVGNTLTCNFGDLTKEDGPRSVTVSAPTNFENCSKLDNTAVASGENAHDASDSASIECERPNLTVVKNGNGTVNAGDEVVFTIEVANGGPGVARNVTLSDSVPSGVAGAWTISSQPDGSPCELSEGKLTCEFGDLVAGAKVPVTIKAPTDYENCATYDNTATAKSGNAPDAADSASVECQKPKIVVNKTDGGRTGIGDDVSFAIKVSNQGPGTARGVVLDDPLSTLAGPWRIGSETKGANCDIQGANPSRARKPGKVRRAGAEGGPRLHCEIGDLAAGESVTVKIHARMNNTVCEPIRNVATGTAENAPGDRDSATTGCFQPHLQLRKKANLRVALPGQKVRYTILVRNTKLHSVATDLDVCDRIPDHMTVTNPGTGKFSDGLLCWNIPRLEGSKKWTRFHYVARVADNAGAGERLRNVVTLRNLEARWTVRVKRPPVRARRVRHTPVTG